MPAPTRVVVLGSTGSVGTQALDVIARNRDDFAVAALAAGGGNVELLARQALDFEVEAVAVARDDAARDLLAALDAEATRRGLEVASTKVLAGEPAAAELAAWPADVVLNAVDGAAGLKATLRALESGARLALANKESLIIGGPLVKALAAPGQIVPVDSEHSAIAQALRGGTADEVRRLVVTASGGPFRARSAAELDDVTPAQALAHPTWSMGPLITVNSATLVNKGLEVIEAHLLFDIPFERIDVVVHPQSIVHSMVEFVDGSTLAQASPPDMRLPIALALGWPSRIADAAPALDWSKASTWEFFPLDDDAFPGVRLARRAGIAGGTAPAVFNGANEACVAAFLDGRIRFTQILRNIERVLDEHLTSGAFTDGNRLDINGVLQADAWARDRARELAEGSADA